MSELPADAFELLIALADDEFVIGHRYSEWLGLSPFLEEDLTMASIAQDELGHARALYALIWPDWADCDALVVRRPASDWRSCALVERENGAWEDSLLRHWIYDTAEVFRWAGLVERFGEVVPGLESLAEKVLVEERFHRRHANDLIERLGEVPAAQSRIVEAWRRFEPFVFDAESAMTESGV